ncbi:MAG TPA: glycosyltransferase family 2 protein [Candidatus Brocadiia bacterium]|nr:glycosyltransferase family 2 protein [Candidatus Brocadiia bacterium]
MSQSNDVEISVVIPAHNEEEPLPLLIPEVAAVLSGTGRSFEIIVINDGSTDATAERLKELRARFPALKIISFARRAGQSAGLDAGFKAARGKAVVTMDADGQNDPRDIPMMLEKLAEYPVVFGVRQKRKDTIVKRAASRIGNWYRNALTGESVKDCGCSLKAFRSECVKGLMLYNSMHRFLPSLMKFREYKFIEVPVNHRPRSGGKTKYGVLDRAAKGLIDCLAVRWMGMRWLDYEVREED